MHDVKHFLKSVNKVHMAIFSLAIFIALTCCCLPLCSCFCCPGVVKALTKCCMNYDKGTHRLVLHHRAMKERKRFKDLMKHLGHPADRANTFLPTSITTLPMPELELLMEQSRLKLSHLENMMNLKITQEQEMDCCPAPHQPSAHPAAPDAQLQLGDASEQ